MERRIIQLIEYDNDLIALASDGTTWYRRGGHSGIPAEWGEWMDALPQPASPTPPERPG